MSMSRRSNFNTSPLRSVIIQNAPLAPVTGERLSRLDTEKTIERPHVARASLAPSVEHPEGSAKHSMRYSNYSVMQQHCLYWDDDGDGVIWPRDTWAGCRDLGFNLLFSFLATIVVHAGLSLPTRLGVSYFPDPFFRIYIETIHMGKHGSDSGVFDTEGRYVPAKFEDIWSKYTMPNSSSKPRTTMTILELWKFVQGNRLAMDPFGWIAGFAEWVAAFLLIQQNGEVDKEDVRKVIDGSIFFEIREARKEKRWNKGWGLGGDGFVGGERMLPFSL